VAGVLAVQFGCQYLQKKYNGIGVSLGMIHGADQAETVVVGGGYVGATAAKTAGGMGGKVTIVNRSKERLERLKDEFRGYLGEKLYRNMSFVQMTDESLMEACKKADLLIGAVLIPGTKAPTVVTEKMVKAMKKGAVVVDVSIDQGGCIWGAKGTSHSEPTYEIDGKIFCCITNMPGQVARQSTQALTHATLPYLKMMAKGIEDTVKASLKTDGRFARGLNTYKGKVTYKAVANDLDLTDKYQDLKEMMG
jgi:alanine dehydrogenase